MQEHEPQFNIPEEKLRAMREEHARNEEEAGKEETTPLSKFASEVEKKMEEDKGPLEPSRETKLLIEEEGGILPDKQQQLLETAAYFQEKAISAPFEILRGERSSAGATREDLEEAEKALTELSAKYEDILEPGEEYPAAREMLKDLEDYLSTLKTNSDIGLQPVSAAWHNLSKRIENFHATLLLKDAKNTEQRQHFFRLLQLIRASILSRIPELGPSIPAREGIGEKPNTVREKSKDISDNLSRLVEGEGALSPEEEERLNEAIDRGFGELEDYMEQHYHYEKLPLLIPAEQGETWRKELEKLIEEKGSKGGTPTSHGKRILLGGEEVEELFGGEVEIWDPNEPEKSSREEEVGEDFKGEKPFPIHITVRGSTEDSRPQYAAIEYDGSIRSSVDWYDDDSSSQEAAEKTRLIPPIAWKLFVETAIEKARAYTPEEPEEGQD